MFSTFASRLIAIAFVGVVFLGAISMYIAYVRTYESVQVDLADRVGRIARTISSRELTPLTGTSADINAPAYLELKDKLSSIRAVSPSVRFVYVMRIEGDSVYFVADSEPVGSPDESPAGQVYGEVDGPTLAYLKEVEAGYEPAPASTPAYRDRWGYWVSVLAPLHDERGRHFVVGADVDYVAMIRQLYVELAAVAGISFFFLALLGAAWYIVLREAAYAKTKVLFMSIASHELRTPLTGIRWSSELLLGTKSKLGKSERTSVQRIHDESVKLILLINDFLEYVSQSSSPNSRQSWALCPISQLLEHSAQIHADALREQKVKLKFTADGDASVYGSRTELQSVIDNVVSNAIKYSQKGGVVNVSTRVDGKKIVLTVTDHGIGISDDDQKKVFVGMYRSPNAKAHTEVGTGFGLSLVKTIVEKHRGTVSLQSALGQGTAITITLPTA